METITDGFLRFHLEAVHGEGVTEFLTFQNFDFMFGKIPGIFIDNNLFYFFLWKKKRIEEYFIAARPYILNQYS